MKNAYTQETRLTKGIRLLSRISRLAADAMDDNDMGRFLHYSFRYANVRLAVYPGTKPVGPGFLLDDIIEERVFNSKF